MKDVLTFLSSPEHLVFLIPIIAILGFAVNRGLSNYYKHKERLIEMEADARARQQRDETYS